MSHGLPLVDPIAWAPPFACSRCRRPYPARGFPHRCPDCGGVYDLTADPTYAPGRGPRSTTGLVRFRESLPLPPDAPLVSLGEGNTPLLPGAIGNTPVFFKCEHLNPTGSFKDRGAAVLVSGLQAGGVEEAVEDSSGNAGAAFAAYAARAGLRARIYVPAYASGPKRAQIQAFGAEVVRIPGPRSAATEAALQAVAEGAVYASHAYLPHLLAGVATLAFELVEALGQAPGSVVTPTGQGSIVLGLQMGFRALRRAGVIERQPRLIGVQASACAPLWAMHRSGADGLRRVQEGETLAEGIRILRPLRGDAVLAAVESSGGTFAAVDEPSILQGREALGRSGWHVEPTSAVVWQAVLDLGDQLPRPVVVILTGSGLKSAPAEVDGGV
jgi:threonine synthase